ncbi:hypothetical protein [Erwinia sorbitola]|uniref:Uncharacterized protein n=1 Tax=Erwinia sorbitola TaxID=2681984 RepID=A0A6I6EL89_9GAMM|nr:hypothetical protein [Erwinia sorbitola]QGU87056.1 hypothetical protein GN242_07430 [Erwinia sorbitola]
MLGEWIKKQVREQERRESDARYDLLCRLPANTFAAIYAENYEVFTGAMYNGEYYSEGEIYSASLARGEGYEVLL